MGICSSVDMILKECLYFSLLGVAERVDIERAGAQATAGFKSSNAVCAVLVHILKVGAGVVGKSEVVQRALQRILDVQDCCDLVVTLVQY